jgi:outer membrane protein X
MNALRATNVRFAGIHIISYPELRYYTIHVRVLSTVKYYHAVQGINRFDKIDGENTNPTKNTGNGEQLNRITVNIYYLNKTIMRSCKVLKKVLIAGIAILTMNVTANAQEKGDMAVGGNLEMGMGDRLTNIGLGAKFQYNVIKPIRIEGSATYFFPKKRNVSDFSMWDFSANGHYLFPINGKLTLYPLVGLGVLVTRNSAKVNGRWERGNKAVNSEFGFNFGGGLDFKLTDRLSLNAELKHKIGDMWSRTLISVGVTYGF